MVQQELYSPDEGPEEHGNPRQPNADPPAPGVSEAVTDPGDPRLIEELAAEEVAPPPVEHDHDFDAIGLLPAEHRSPADHGVEAHGDALGDIHVQPSQTDLTFGGFAQPQPLPRAYPEAPERSFRLEALKEELFAWLRTLTSAAVYATLIVTFGFQVARVEGLSMAPTLEDQDRLIVNKLAYRLGAPRRGDIVMLYYPVNPDKSFVKRVIAEENDEVRIVEGQVYVNDVPLPDSFVPPEYKSHDDFPSTRVPEGYYFVMGDHRNNSSDSRHWGMVPKKYIIGRVQVRWWPIPHARMF